MQAMLFGGWFLATIALLQIVVVAAADKLYGGTGYCDGLTHQQCESMPGRTFDNPGFADSEVSYERFKHMLSTRNVQLFDVRTTDEFKEGSIPQPTNIPLGELEEALKLTAEQFRMKFGVRAPQKEDDDFVLFCQKGRRSATALDIAHSLGFSRAQHYAGGYDEWERKAQQAASGP